MPYSKEADDLPALCLVRPIYDNTGAVSGVVCQFNWMRRVKNDADAADQLPPLETASKAVDLWDNVKTVNVPGVGNITYRNISRALKLVADAERGT